MEGAIEFGVLFEQLPEVLLVLLPDAPRYTMVAATRARFAATHTTPETIGRGLFELFPDNPDDPAADGASNLRASLDRVRATRAADTMAVQKYDIQRPDGSFEARYWSPKNVPILAPSGELLYILHRVEDVTELVRSSEVGEELRDRTRQMEREVLARSRELRHANDELRVANARLGELDAAKTDFFNNVSHELRTPLTLILGPLEDGLSDEAEPLGPRQRARVDVALANAGRLLKLVNTLLDFSRFEAGRLAATYAPLDVPKFTAELAGMFQSAADSAGIALDVSCPPLDEPLWVDRDMWEKIVPNLLSNALKFTFEGRISVRTRDEGATFVLEVADTGVGIPEHELPRIFDRFHRVADARGRTHEGTGIGLALVRELVHLHGGTVAAESTVGQGTVFRVAIPKGHAHLAPASVRAATVDATGSRGALAYAVEAERWTRDDDDGARSPSSRPPAEAPRPPHARVLVVDDNADLREYVSGLLASTYDVTRASDGLEALEIARASRPDIVVSDLMMPRLDGLGLVRALRAEPETASLPIILLSARAGEDSAIAGLDVGADDYLKKPFSAPELLARVRTHVELARVRNGLLAELEATNKDLDAFSYSVSHDLRAPLRAIAGFAQIIEEDHASALDERGRDYLGRIIRNAATMSNLIEALLGLARLARSPVTPDEVDLSALARAIAGELRQEDPKREVEVRIEDGLIARGDRALLRIVLVNLIGNAWKYTLRTPAPRIEVARAPDATATFLVRDNGVGFDMVHAERLFAPFQRLHSAAEFEGTGIGLATVRRVIARHRGRVWAESEPGRGATFYFSLRA